MATRGHPGSQAPGTGRAARRPSLRLAIPPCPMLGPTTAWVHGEDGVIPHLRGERGARVGVSDKMQEAQGPPEVQTQAPALPWPPRQLDCLPGMDHPGAMWLPLCWGG